ncbi:hypothetical protein LH23_18295 [Cedecea neteri]|uniref:Uncharacterized protein n=2 Tax=Cedecea neteri TaxID=158822 RepID=A0AAN0S7Z9_9ENTR|nr:hypothetical protein LH23_18295 [Cedecea neteri]
MMLVDISLQMIQARIEVRILMMKKIITINTNYVKRYAKNINDKNDICNFDGLLPAVDGISAVSWEWHGYSRREYGGELLKKIFSTLTDNDSDNIHLMVQLSPEQPNTAIVNYKKTWGLIESSGVKTDVFWGKKSFIDKGNKDLVLTGVCCADSCIASDIQKLINVDEKLFFSNLSPDLIDTHVSVRGRMEKWIENILHNDGVIFFLLGRFDESDSEVVAIGKEFTLRNIMR